MSWHPKERDALVEALESSGPGAPTLCAGWSTEHLAAHVALRESDLSVSVGIVLPPLAARTERVTRRLGEESADPADYALLLQRLRRGPATWHPLRWAGDAAQLLELFVHTEDVRRAGPGGAAARPLPAAQVQALWTGLTRMVPLLYRGSPVGVVLDDGEGRRARAARPAKDGPCAGEDIRVTGPVGELVLHAFGRSEAAHVDVLGRPEAVAAFIAR